MNYKYNNFNSHTKTNFMKTNIEILKEKIYEGLQLNETYIKINEPKYKTIKTILQGVLDEIKNIENENKLIGQFGYFWHNDYLKSCTYGKLINIKNEKYYCKSYTKSGNDYDNFSLTIPEHLK